jgi:hypothetical protein
MVSAPDETPDFETGTAGASARREHQRRRASREAGTRRKHPRIGGLLLSLRDAPAPEQAWARGEQGEEQLARRLAKHLADGTVLLHDRRMPSSRANIDHIAVAPSGVWVIDAKRYRGKVAVSKPLFGEAKLRIAGRDRSRLADGLAQQVAAVQAVIPDIGVEVPVHGALCFVDGDLPMLGTITFRGYPLVYPRALARRINAKGGLPREQLHTVAARLSSGFPAA